MEKMTMEASSASEKVMEAPLCHVDPFLVEALQNSRHRLTVLRMEYDIQKFMQNAEQDQFEFQNYPTSYLRCAAHRVAQHYGLHTVSLDNGVDGIGSRILAVKTPDSKFPAACLSEVPAKQSEKDLAEQVKVVLRPRPNKSPYADAAFLQKRRTSVKTVEEREEEYEKARARIFNSSTFSDVDGPSDMASSDRRSFYISRDEVECSFAAGDQSDKIGSRDGTSKVAIFRDMEKDRTDPDYDRSNVRYVRGLSPNNQCNVLQSPFPYYDAGFSQLGQFTRNQTPVGFRPPVTAMSPIPSSSEAVYQMQWPSPSMMYAHSYGHVRTAIFQAPSYQHNLSFKHQ